MKPVYNITPFTLLDYPGKTACILWFAGCNMKCLYCYNPDIVFGKGKISFAESLKFLRTRVGLLDGVVLSGGECTLHRGIEHFAAEIKDLGMLLKLDTNGSRPAVLRSLIEKALVDYIALDFKAPSSKYQEISGSALFKEFEKSLDILLSAALPYEIRTTVHSDLLHYGDLEEMISFLEQKNFAGVLYLQNFLNNTPVIGKLGTSERLKGFDTLQSCIEIVIRN